MFLLWHLQKSDKNSCCILISDNCRRKLGKLYIFRIIIIEITHRKCRLYNYRMYKIYHQRPHRITIIRIFETNKISLCYEVSVCRNRLVGTDRINSGIGICCCGIKFRHGNRSWRDQHSSRKCIEIYCNIIRTVKTNVDFLFISNNFSKVTFIFTVATAKHPFGISTLMKIV